MCNRCIKRRVKKVIVREYDIMTFQRGIGYVKRRVHDVRVDIGDRIVPVVNGYPLPGEVVLYDPEQNICYRTRRRSWKDFVRSCRKLLQVP